MISIGLDRTTIAKLTTVFGIVASPLSTMVEQHRISRGA